MNGTTFDTLAMARALREAGFDERQAEAVAEAVRSATGAGRDTLATKAEYRRLRAAIDAHFTALRAEAALRADAALRSEARADLYRSQWAQGVCIVAAVTALNAAFGLYG